MLDVFVQVQLGISLPLAMQRGFLLENCGEELEQRGINEAKLVALDGKFCSQMLKKFIYDKYLSCVPFRVFGFDMEFTGPPSFRSDGPTEDIIEIGLYSPARQSQFSCLVLPHGKRPIQPEVEKLTGITNQQLQKEGVPFKAAWERCLSFLRTPDDGEEVDGAEDRWLLLSHGGKVADQGLIKHTLEATGLELPREVVFGDTHPLIRDAHRRRPVTADRHPPTWGLTDLAAWLNLPPLLPAHRAGNDAEVTWQVLYHTLLRYGDDTLTPKQQLVEKFFDEESKRRLKEMKSGSDDSGSGTSLRSQQHNPELDSTAVLLDTDFDTIFEKDRTTLVPAAAKKEGEKTRKGKDKKKASSSSSDVPPSSSSSPSTRRKKK